MSAQPRDRTMIPSPIPLRALRPVDDLPVIVDRTRYYQAERDRAAAGYRADDGPQLPRGLTPGRQAGAAYDATIGLFGWKTIPRRAYSTLDVQRLDITRMAPFQVMEVLAEVSPDVSQALWNMLLLTNSGYSFDVLDAAGKTDERGQALLAEILADINVRGGGLDALINQWHYTAYLQGAVAGEIALSPDLTGIEDLYAVTPWTIEFVRDTPRPRSVQRVPGERQPRELNQETFHYLPVFPAPDDPYGRMPFASVLYALSFDLQLLRDLQVAVHANAWDKLDITVLESVIVEGMPPEKRHDPRERMKWVNATIDQIRNAFDGMQPDDHHIHTDGTKIAPVTSGNRSVGIVPVFRLLERRIIRALKQLPILMGSNEGTTETHGTVQYEVFVDGIRAVQQLVKAMLDRMLTLGLQVRGHQGTVVMTWDAIRTTDRKADADAEAVEITNAAAKRDQGWIDQDTASDEVTGSVAVLPEPVQREPVAVAAAD